jgi:hypothetical protein
MTDTFQLDCEYTGTYAGESNYGWVRRATLDLPKGISDRAVVRRAKAALGLSGVRGKMHCYGDRWEFRPYGECTVAFFMVRY